MRKARLLCLTDKYEKELISSTGKLKKEYIGQIGKVIHTCVISKDHYVKPILYDVQFGDGLDFALKANKLSLWRELND